MRSSVSMILSSLAPDTRMSHPDFDQKAHDHAALLVLVHNCCGESFEKGFNSIYDRIKNIDQARVTVSSGESRTVWARYVKEYAVESNEWGDFQTHRRLLGLITVGQYENQVEMDKVCLAHESLKVRYNSTLFDSRCILIGEKWKLPENFKSVPLWYSNVESCTGLDDPVKDLLSSLFWVLESKREERSREKIDRVSLLLAPFERKDIVGLDMDSRPNKKRCLGRLTKHLGDLSLQAGIPHNAIYNYMSASEILHSVNDWLWLGGALEGLCAASVVILYPERRKTPVMYRNASLPPSPGKRSARLDRFRTWNSRPNSAEGNAGPNAGPSSLPSSLLPVPTVPEDSPRPLSAENILKRYQEAIVNYTKYQNAGVIEVEACLKAAQVAIQQGCPLQAASFLKNVTLISLTLSESEKIQLYLSLSALYTEMGFHRKASFCRQLAAPRHVSALNKRTDWPSCYNLILEALQGHRLSLDPTERYANTTTQGWPALQIHLLQQLVLAARRMGKSQLAARHLTFLLQTLWHHLTPTEQRDTAKKLHEVASECEGSPVSLTLDTGIVIPPANLTNIPLAKSFVLQNLQPHLRPQKIENIKEDSGPFLFTPVSFGSLERTSAQSHSRMDYVWVEGDVCEVAVKFHNPLPFELSVLNMRLLTSGVVFESIPASTILPPNSGPHTITLSGTPKEVGDLDINGYSTHTLGVKSNCQLRHIPQMPQPSFSVEVVSALPTVEVSTSLPASLLTSSFGDSSLVIASAAASLYAGESCEFTLSLRNVSAQPIEMLEVSTQSLLDDAELRNIIDWSVEDIKAQLPLMSGNTATLTLRLHGAADFIAPVRPDDLGSEPSSLLSGPTSLPSRLSSPSPHPSHQARNDMASGSFRSIVSYKSGSSGSSSRNTHPKPHDPFSPKVIDCQLKLRYSGGPGLEAGYCRTCAIALSIEILPSVLISNWDVLPAETSSRFYLVLDVANMTTNEMELNYAPSKCLLIEGTESCRIPVPVARCPLSKLTKLYEGVELTAEERAEVDRVCSDHIARLVDLEWSQAGRRGKATLSGLTLASHMLDLVRMSPLHWELVVDKDVVKPLSEVKSVAGRSVCLGITVQNFFEKPLQDVALTLRFYQDHQNGGVDYLLDTRLAVVGAPTVLLPELKEQGSAYHECNVVFFTPGQYKIDIQCFSQARATLVKLARSRKTSSDIAPVGHVWRYIPPVEITVSEQ